MRARLKTFVPLRDPSRAITAQQYGMDMGMGIKPLKGVSW